jgi:hypothetical protein
MCPVSKMYWEYREFCLVTSMAYMCSLSRVLNIRPAFPFYFSGNQYNLVGIYCFLNISVICFVSFCVRQMLCTWLIKQYNFNIQQDAKTKYHYTH